MQSSTTRRRFVVTAAAVTTGLLAGCTSGGNGDGSGDGEDGSGGTPTPTPTPEPTDTDGMDDGNATTPTDPATAPRASVDQFSEAAGTLMVRSGENGLPGPNEPVDFDQGPFVTRGLGPDGEMVTYYNFASSRPRRRPSTCSSGRARTRPSRTSST